jgi:hypothetical protein
MVVVVEEKVRAVILFLKFQAGIESWQGYSRHNAFCFCSTTNQISTPQILRIMFEKENNTSIFKGSSVQPLFDHGLHGRSRMVFRFASGTEGNIVGKTQRARDRPGMWAHYFSMN